jgi:hypothetical protein
MKKVVLIFASLLVIVAVSNNAKAQSTPSVATATASAQIIQPLVITKVADLAFGNIAAGTTSGTVVIDTDGNRMGDGGITLITAGSVSNAANFSITGYPDATFTIELPTSILIASSDNQMTVDNFVSSLGETSSLDAMGESMLNVGATLNVEANQAPGLYEGTFDVTVAYN